MSNVFRKQVKFKIPFDICPSILPSISQSETHLFFSILKVPKFNVNLGHFRNE